MTSKKVFIADNVFFAFIDRAHPKHPQAAAYFRYFAQEKYQLYTGMFNLVESYNEIAEKISPSLARDFLRAMMLGSINILYPDEGDMKAAIKTLTSFDSSELTFSQASLAVLANRRGIFQICTFEYLHNLFGLTLFYLPI